MMTNQQRTRQWDLDWIKVLVMLIVFMYHCSMFFNPFAWHIKNNEIDTSYIYAFSLLVGTWMMPVFFAISGISTYHALLKRSGGVFIKERLTRLGVPLLLGIFVLSPPQVFIERESTGQYTGSFLSFLPKYFDGLYLEIGGTGNFSIAGHHLWYLLLLLLFSILTFPVFSKLRTKVEDKPFGSLHYWFLLLPLLVASLTVNDVFNLASWGIGIYFIIYIYGFLFFSRHQFRTFIRRSGIWTGLLFGASLLVFVCWVMIWGFSQGDKVESLLFTVLTVFMTWNALFFIFFAAQKWLSMSNKFLSYSSEALMPFYVMHQPVIVLVGYLLYQLELPIAIKAIILTFGSFLLIMGVYHFVFRHMNIARYLLGIPRIRKQSTMSQ